MYHDLIVQIIYFFRIAEAMALESGDSRVSDRDSQRMKDRMVEGEFNLI
jgi:hypothetical protein